jgi:hypothetical protein
MKPFTPEQFTELARTATDPLAEQKAAAILNDTLDPETVEATEDWVRQCFHKPSDTELKMHALNALFDCHGVEAIRVDGAWVDSYHHDIVAAYLNTGDTYALTVVLDSETGEFLLTSYGDYMEAYETAQAELAAGE